MGRILVDNRYELRGLVGVGGMAEVYLAHDVILGREVALKLLKARYVEDEEFIERFRREARSAASLASPYIVPIFDRGETEDGTYYIAMEYLPGGTLKDRIRTTGAPPPRIATEVALQIAQALQTAHKKGIVHRDVKPHNILYADSGHLKVVDFGIARATEATTISHIGDILGSVKYMSPEQAAGERVGPRSDLYSLGVVLYEMLTGRVPFEAKVPADVPVEHAGGPPRHPKELDPEVPEALDAIVMRLLSRDPADRYGSAAELIEELGRVHYDRPPANASAEEAPTVALRAPAAPAFQPPVSGSSAGTRRRRLFWILTIFAVLVAVLGVVGWSLLRDPGNGGVPGAVEGATGKPPDGTKRELPSTKQAKVPNVEGLSEQEARKRLTQANFKVQVRSRENSEEDTGKVLEQSIAAKKKVDKGSKILLTVGEDQQVAKVPNLVSLPYSEAEAKLEEAGFLLGGVEEVPSDTVPAGMIVKQDPPPGTTLKAGTYVYLKTSVGPPNSTSVQ